MSKTHNIKIRESYADAVLKNERTFEIRLNDRDYREGDIICYQVVKDDTRKEIDHPLNGKKYVITYLMQNFGVQEQWCAFGFKKLPEPEPEPTPIPDVCGDDYCTINYDELSSNDMYSYSGIPQYPQRPIVDPNTQCVDCRFGTPIQTPDGLATTIRCEVYHGEIRNPQDTCIGNIVNMNSFTVKKKDEG